MKRTISSRLHFTLLCYNQKTHIYHIAVNYLVMSEYENMQQPMKEKTNYD